MSISMPPMLVKSVPVLYNINILQILERLMVMPKKIVAVYGSHRKNGNSNFVVDTLLSTIPDGSAEVQKFYLSSMNIHHCTGCFHCRAEGECMHKDDMNGLLDAIMVADKIILATPIFMFQSASTFNQFQARCYPLLKGVNGQYTSRMEPKDTIMVYSQGAPVPFAFKTYIDLNQNSLNMMGFNVKETIVCTSANEIGSAEKNSELYQNLLEIGRNFFD